MKSRTTAGLVCVAIAMAGTATVTWADSHQYKQSTDIPVSVTTPDEVETSR